MLFRAGCINVPSGSTELSQEAKKVLKGYDTSRSIKNYKVKLPYSSGIIQ
jgi:hypothetical protein